MKGIVLAGGSGSRMHPVTKGVSKHLLPVFDKPMIYYPISVLMLAGIREILVITTSQDLGSYRRLLGDGEQFGVSFQYVTQDLSNGIAEAFIIGEKFIGSDDVALILGDNIFYGHGFTSILKKSIKSLNGATIFGYKVKDPKRFGVVEFDENMRVLSLEEKPNMPKSNHVVTGLYFYDNDVIDIAKQVKPSARGELEITSINNFYLGAGNISIELLGRGFSWLDSGTHESLLEAGLLIQTLETRQGLKIACLEEIGLSNGWISSENLIKSMSFMGKSSYSDYLRTLLKQDHTAKVHPYDFN
jgi:glucose-1-phosphate thymidylyltransferase